MVENINLKYLIVGVISLSILMVAGAYIFSKIPNQTNVKPSPDASPRQKTQIRIIYPSADATRSSVPLHKPAPIPKIEVASDGGSIQGSGSVPKDLPKP